MKQSTTKQCAVYEMQSLPLPLHPDQNTFRIFEVTWISSIALGFNVLKLVPLLILWPCDLVALQEDWQLQLQNKLQWIKYYWNNINVTPGTKVMIGVHKSSLLPPMSEFNFPYCMMIMTCNVLWCAFVRRTLPYLFCHHCFYRSVHKLFGDMCPKRDEHFRLCAYMELVKLLFLINFYLKISLN